MGKLFIKIFYFSLLLMILCLLYFQLNTITKMVIINYNKLNRIEKILRINENKIFRLKNKPFYVNLFLKVTAYSSEVDQCDSDPFIGAWNNKVRDGMVAVSRDLEKYGLTNGTPIIIDGKEYIILDRMHKRKKKQLDIWMPSIESAKNWGVKECIVKIPIKVT